VNWFFLCCCVDYVRVRFRFRLRLRFKYFHVFLALVLPFASMPLAISSTHSHTSSPTFYYIMDFSINFRLCNFLYFKCVLFFFLFQLAN